MAQFQGSGVTRNSGYLSTVNLYVLYLFTGYVWYLCLTEGNQGSVLIFGAYLAHRSGDNKTDNSRVAIYLTYNAAREGDRRDHYYDEKRRLFPPASDREEGKNYGKLWR
jgi:hypothetical protein